MDESFLIPKKRRRTPLMENVDRLEKLEKAYEELLEIVTKQQSDETKSAENLENEMERAGKRKLQSSPKTIDLERPTSSTLSSKYVEPSNLNAVKVDLLPNEEILQNSKKSRRESEASNKIQIQNKINQSEEKIIGSEPRTDRNTKEDEAAKKPDLPKFDGKSRVSLQKWLSELEDLAKEHGWDDTTLINNMKNSLEDDGLQWFNRQSGSQTTWQLWKKRLFARLYIYLGREQVDRLQEFVNNFRRSDERIMNFFHTKKKLGESLGLRDSMICNVIIHRLRDQYIEDSCLEADCKDTRSLFKYLNECQGLDRDKYNLICDTCGRRGHATSQCYGPCKFCKKAGHRSEFCRYRQ